MGIPTECYYQPYLLTSTIDYRHHCACLQQGGQPAKMTLYVYHMYNTISMQLAGSLRAHELPRLREGGRIVNWQAARKYAPLL